MSIIGDLDIRGIKIEKTSNFYKGYCNTKKGVVVSVDKSKCENGIYFLKMINENCDKIVPCNKEIVYIISGTEYENKITSKEEAEQLAKEGKIYSFNTWDLYAEYYNFYNDADLKCCFKYGYSDRSRKYIRAIINNIGLIEYTDASNGFGGKDGEPTEFDIICKYALRMNADTEVGKIESGLWIAQTSFWIKGADDFAVIKMYFSHKPSVKDVETAFEIRRFERNPIEVFTCRECGKLENWLNLEGDIEKKLDMVEEKYCGC